MMDRMRRGGYTGTSYQLDCTLDGVPFGDPLIITCEV